MTEYKCLRCGKCCKGCEYLIKGLITRCSVYETRLGRKIKRNRFVCVMRNNLKENFEGCPYNEM